MTAPGPTPDLTSPTPPLVIVVGSGGVGKTTLAAAFGLLSARSGHDTLVMTFDPSRRLKDALGVDAAARGEEVPVPLGKSAGEGTEPLTELRGRTAGSLHASLLDAGETFDRLIARQAPSEAARDRILGNRYYRHLSGHLGGILEYMAVERLYEVASEGRYRRVILDTPPTRQAIDFLEAPERIVSFLDSGALKIALAPWFDQQGQLRTTKRLGFVGRGFEHFLDRLVGMQLLRDMSEFFRAFGPLFPGFKRRARSVRELLADPGTLFVLVTGPGLDRVPDTLYFARRLVDAGYRLGPIVVNRVHPRFGGEAPRPGPSGRLEGRPLFAWLGDRHHRGLEHLRRLLPADQVVVELPLVADQPTDLGTLEGVGRDFHRRLGAV